MDENRHDATTPRRATRRLTDPCEPSQEDDRFGAAIVEAAFIVHRAIGPGLLESVYETCFCRELLKMGVEHERQVVVPLVYDGVRFDEAFRIDVLVGGRVVCELKAVERTLPIHQAQLLTHLRLTNLNLGFLINFNVPFLKDGIKRVIQSQ